MPPALIKKLFNQPYLLMPLTALFWAGNIIVGRYVAHHIPPITLTSLRWIGACLLILPFAWRHLRKDKKAISKHLPMLLLLSMIGFGLNNALSYWALQHTQAITALLIQSSNPLFFAFWAWLLLGVGITLPQTLGIMLSITGVLIILLRGNFTVLNEVSFNIGDLIFMLTLVFFGLYSVLMARRPPIHPLSLIAVTMGCGGLMLLPGVAWEMFNGQFLAADNTTIFTLIFVILFPSVLSYLFFNKSISLIGPNRVAPFLHLTPVFGSAMAILFLGEKLELFHLVGYALVLAGIFFAARQQKQPARQAG